MEYSAAEDSVVDYLGSAALSNITFLEPSEGRPNQKRTDAMVVEASRSIDVHAADGFRSVPDDEDFDAPLDVADEEDDDDDIDDDDDDDDDDEDEDDDGFDDGLDDDDDDDELEDEEEAEDL